EALALDLGVRLYVQDDLYNGKCDYDSINNQDGTQLINQHYEKDKWKRAADAAKEVIDLNQYELYTFGDGNDPYKNYENLFLEKWNEEIIFGTADNGASDLERHSAPRSVNGWSGIGPTQKQVDAYFMANGKAIDEKGSSYVEEGFSSNDTKYTEA